jgi:uncharacterized protein (DUF697 family)
MAEDVQLIIKAVLDDQAFQAGLKRMNAGMIESSSFSKDFMKGLKNGAADMVSGAAIAAAAIAALIKVTVDSAKAYMEAEEAEMKLANAMKANGIYTEEAYNELIKFSTQVMFATNVTKEETMELLKMAINMGLTKDQAMEAAKGAIGLHAALGVEMTRAIRGSVAALQGHTEQLTRYIPELKNTKDGAEKVALAMHLMKVGFMEAEANTKSFSGQMTFLKNVGHEFEEIIGKGIAQGLKPALESLQKFINSAEGMKTIQGVAKGIAMAFIVLEGVMTTGFRGLSDVVTMIVDQLEKPIKIINDIKNGNWKQALYDLSPIQLGKDVIKWGKDVVGGFVDMGKGIKNIVSDAETSMGSLDGVLKKSNSEEIKDLSLMKNYYKEYFDKLEKETANSSHKRLEIYKMETKLMQGAFKTMGDGIVDGLTNSATTTKDVMRKMIKSVGDLIGGELESMAMASAALIFAPPPLGGPQNILATAEAEAGSVAVRALASTIAGSFAGGISNVPYDMMAMIHKGEAIVDAHHNPYSGMPGMMMPMSAFGGGMVSNVNNNSNSSMVQNNNVHTTGMTMNDMMSFFRRTGANPLSR